MKPGNRHTTLALGLTMLTLAIVAGYSYSRLLHHRDTVVIAAADYAQCLSLAQAIEAARATAAPEGQNPFESRQLLQAIQEAAESAEIDPERAVRSIRPRPGKRVDKTPYLEHAAELKLRQITRKQLVAFVATLVENSAGLRVSMLQLSTADVESETDQWNVDPLLLTYLAYEPIVENTTNATRP